VRRRHQGPWLVFRNVVLVGIIILAAFELETGPVSRETAGAEVKP